jgi:signal peptidase II
LKLRLGNWIGLAAIVVLVDQWTKHLVRGALRNGEVIRVTDWFDLVLAFNPGARSACWPTSPAGSAGSSWRWPR